jgi:hypothetical protein
MQLILALDRDFYKISEVQGYDAKGLILMNQKFKFLSYKNELDRRFAGRLKLYLGGVRPRSAEIDLEMRELRSFFHG